LAAVQRPKRVAMRFHPARNIFATRRLCHLTLLPITIVTDLWVGAGGVCAKAADPNSKAIASDATPNTMHASMVLPTRILNQWQSER
jgi:hypothetical protein